MAFANPAAIDNDYDVNCDGRINALDLVIVRDHAADLSTRLQMIQPAASLVAKSQAEAGESKRSSLGMPEPLLSRLRKPQLPQRATPATDDFALHAAAIDRLMTPYGGIVRPTIVEHSRTSRFTGRLYLEVSQRLADSTEGHQAIIDPHRTE